MNDSIGSFFRDFIFELAIPIAAFFVVGIGTVYLLSVVYAATLGPLACRDLGAGLNAKAEYHFWYGCFVEMPDGRRLPSSEALAVMKQEYRIQVK